MLRFKVILKIAAFILLMQGWMPYFVGNGGSEYIERFFKLLAVYLCLSYYEQSQVENRAEKSVTVLLTGLCASNLLDELFFNPLLFSWNEIIGAIIAIFISIAQYFNLYEYVKRTVFIRISTKCKACFLQLYKKLINSWKK